MKTLKLTEEQIVFTLKQAEIGTPVREGIRKTYPECESPRANYYKDLTL
jgi:hypothetical protein